ncbi:MAG: hypothetical protein OEW04_01375 [Nitrospirota bacterium]|nr:hypothetical protein [Nitrospirota bacterium]
MKRIGGNLPVTFLLAMVMILLFSASGFAGFRGFADIGYSTSKFTDEAGETTSNALSQNYFLTLDRQITPKISYSLFLRAALSDSTSTDIYGNEKDTYGRSAEPNIDIILSNTVYSINMGYRRTESWTTSKLEDESRNTAEYYYSRFSLYPVDLPSLTLQADRQRAYNYLSPRTSDTTTTTYSVGTGYQFKYRDYRLSYNAYYNHGETETPLSLTSKTTSDNFSGSYFLGHTRSFLNNRVNIAFDYRANYGSNKSTVFSEQTQNVLLKRTALQGLHDQGSYPPLSSTYDFALSNRPELINADFNTGITAINILAGQYHNIGIQVSSDRSVDRLYIYVNQDVRNDANLTNPSNWRVYRSDFNATGTWSLVTVLNVTVSVYDSLNNIYRYEILFASPQNADYFKAVNQVTAGIVGPPDVLVTEVEAYGTDLLQQGKTESESTFFAQGLSMSGNYNASAGLRFSLSYFINRSDSDPDSILNSTQGIFKNIFSKSFDDVQGMQSNVTRSYSLGSTWLVHRLLTVNAAVGRSELFDSSKRTDLSTNSYNLSFLSSPLPTLSTNLSLMRSESYSFGEKQYTSHSVVLTADSRLYEGVTMITDLGYSTQESYSPDTNSRTSSYFVSGSLAAVLTKKLSGHLNYGFRWLSSEDDSSSAQDGSLLVTYRPGRFINFTGNLGISNADGDLSYRSSVSADWLPLPAIRMNFNYQRIWTDPESTTSDLLGSYVSWKITNFMDGQLTYSFAKVANDNETKSHSITGKLNCRF